MKHVDNIMKSLYTPHFLTPVGVNCILLPVHPTAMISIPIIKNAIPKNRDTNAAPAYGDAIIKKDIAIAKAPAPILNPLVQPGLSLLPSPFTTWKIPANSKPMPNIIIANTAACTGYPTAIEPKMRASTPSPTVPQRELFFHKYSTYNFLD